MVVKAKQNGLKRKQRMNMKQIKIKNKLQNPRFLQSLIPFRELSFFPSNNFPLFFPTV